MTKEKLGNVEEKYQEVCNLNYIQDKDARDELIEIIDLLRKDESLVLEKTSNHDMSVRFKGRQIVKICPLKKGWSASVNGGRIGSYDKGAILSALKDLKVDPSKVIKKVNDVDIKKLEERIAKMSKDSKGINIKGFQNSKELKDWVGKKGYKLDGETLLVK